MSTRDRAPTKAGTIKNVGKTSRRRYLNSSREGRNMRDSSHSRYSRDETTAVRTHQQKARQQHLQETNGTVGDANNSRDVKTEALVEEGMLTTAGKPQQELQEG
jgi:hypothetical protein